MYILFPYMAGEGGEGGVQPILKHENVRHVSFLNPAAPLIVVMVENDLKERGRRRDGTTEQVCAIDRDARAKLG